MSEERNYEKEARREGWKPESEWHGDPPQGGFKTAEQFVGDGEEISGLLKTKIGRLEDRIDSLTQSNAEFKQYTDKQFAKEHDKNKQLIADLEAAKAQAITDGDGAAAVRAEKEINGLQAENAPPDNAEHNLLAQQWASENKWYANNKKLGAFADGIAERIVQQGYRGQAYWNELTRQVEETFPEEFENPNRNKAGSVESGGTKEVLDSKAKTWANLPKADKEAANRFIKDIPGFTKEAYVEQYDWE